MKLVTRRVLLVALLAVTFLAVIAGGLFYGYWIALKHAWIQYNEFDIRSEGMLRVGDLAPDLELAAAADGALLRLSDFYQDKPLVLIFGSYT